MRLAIHVHLLAAVLALGCTQHTRPSPEPIGPLRPGAVEPADDVERAILQRLPSLPPGQPAVIGDHTVVADPAYPAASGRTCRALHITLAQERTGGGARHRLACRADGDWFFVPQVFQAEAGDASPP